MRETDFVQVVEQMVAEELALRLAPFQQLLGRLDQARATLKLRHGPGRPPRAEVEQLQAILLGTGKASAGRKARTAKAARKAAKAYEPGDVVHYRQGRGTFEAFVIRTEPDGEIVVERVSDGKRVKRPASKLI